MKVLLLPNNIGSMTAITLQALNNAGHQAIGLILGGDRKQNHRNLKVYPYAKGGLVSAFNFFKWYLQFLRYVLWADVIHWNGSFSFSLLKITLPIIKILRKKAIVEFVGSDIRIPEVEFKDNKYFKDVFYNGYEYFYESKEISERNQLLFSRAGFGLILLPGISQYISGDLFKVKINLFQRLLINDFSPKYPDKTNKRPLIVHIPSAPFAKGTQFVTEAIKKLKMEFEFEFILIQNLPHQEALALIQKCDIYIDQLIIGSYGMATMEALSFGKPVICYIKDSVKNEFPADCPVVNANPENLYFKLKELLLSGDSRNQIGVLSRAYSLRVHDAKNTIGTLSNFYASL